MCVIMLAQVLAVTIVFAPNIPAVGLALFEFGVCRILPRDV